MAMARRFIPSNMAFYDFGRYEEPTRFKKIAWCFIRKDHTCDKYLGASKSCFIACPSTPEVKLLTDLISEKLIKIGIEPIVAIDLRAYGQDIFCTKICGKIIESQFCIAILDDISQGSNGKKKNIPNPNVYYEYGLMTALSKYVIPLQKDGQSLAFNIKSHDTIKYTPDNASIEIEKALKDATRITTEERGEYTGEIMPERMYHSFLAISGYQRVGYGTYPADDLSDTIFSGYRNTKRSEYVFFTVINDKEMLKSCIMDIQVITKRLEERFEDLVDNVELNVKELEKLQDERKKAEETPVVLTMRSAIRDSSSVFIERKIGELTGEIEKTSNRIEMIQNSKFAVVLIPELLEFREKCEEELGNVKSGVLKLPTYFGDVSGIKIADVEIQFKAPAL